MSGTSGSGNRSTRESDDEGCSDTETLTCPRILRTPENSGQAEEQSMPATPPPEDEQLTMANSVNRTSHVTEQRALLLNEFDAERTRPVEPNSQEVDTAINNGQVGIAISSPLLTNANNVTGGKTELSKKDELGMLVQGCFSVRETLSDYREKDITLNGTILDDAAGIESSKIGGDIRHIYMAAAQVGEAEVTETLNKGGQGDAITATSDKLKSLALIDKDVGPSRRPISAGVGVAPGSGSEEKKKKGTRLPLPVTPTQSYSTGGLNQVKKLPVLSPLSPPSPTATAPLKKQKPTAASTSASPFKSSNEKSPSTVGRSRPSLPRAQTARPSRPDDSPLASDSLNLKLPDRNKRSASDLSRLLKPTASCSAKYTGAKANSARASPSKSFGDNKLQKSTSAFMMGDAGNGTGGNSPSPTPAPAETTTSGGGSGEPAGGSGGLKEQFAAFSKFGDSTSDGKQITLSNADKWMKQAHVVDGKKITTTDTSIAFKKLFKTSKKVGLDDFKRYVEHLAKSKGLEGNDILEKLTNCGSPGLSQATKAAHAGVVSRLTDTSKYTGSHKERFDSTGKGRGIEGRRDVPDGSGYVASFKAKQESQSPTAK